MVVFIKEKMGSRRTAIKVFFALCDDTILDVGKVFSFKRSSRVFSVKAFGHKPFDNILSIE